MKRFLIARKRRLNQITCGYICHKRRKQADVLDLRPIVNERVNE